MEGNDPGQGKRKFENETSGQSQIEYDKKPKLEEEIFGQSQNEKGKQKMEEDTYDEKSQNENVKEILKEETEEKSQKPKSLQCYFCIEMFCSQNLYIMHVETYHPNFIKKKTRKRSVHGQILVVDYFLCYLCPEELHSKETLLRHLNEGHQSKSWAETIKRFGNAESEAELFGPFAPIKEDNLDIKGLSDLPLNEEDWEAFINELPSSRDQEKCVVDNIDDQEKIVFDKVDDPEKSVVDKVDDHAVAI